MGKGGGMAATAPARTPHRPVHGKKKQAAIQQAQELRKAKKQLQKRHSATTTTTNTHATENIIPQVSDAMVQHRVLLSCVDRIRSLLPKTDKPTPSSSSQQPRQDRGRDRSADIARLLPFQPLKRHVLWMTPKEQDASSTLTLTQELEAFADYVSLNPVEDQARQGLLDDVRDAINSKLPRGARMRAFGSYPAGLSIYMSDVDVSIHGLGVGIDDDNDDDDDEGETGKPSTGNRGQETAPAPDDEDDEVEVVWSLDTGPSAAPVVGGKKRPRDHHDPDDDAPAVIAADAYSSEEEEEKGENNSGKDPALDEDIDVSFNLAAVVAATVGTTHTNKKGAPPSAAADDDARRQRVLEVLRSLFAHLKQLHWVAEIELRKFARVPIICLVHRNGLQCDISVGVKAGDTSRQVAAMQAMAPPPPPPLPAASAVSPFHALCAFLKVFLAGLGLDKPFTGGIGSYKLYVMVAVVLDLDRQRQHPTPAGSAADLGALLLSFFQHFGDARHLNADTVLRLVAPTSPPVKMEASFAGATQVRACQRAFSVAHKTLADDLRGCEGGVRSLAWLRPPPPAAGGGDSDRNSNNGNNGNGNKKGKGFSFAGTSGAIGDLSRYSRSFLARLVDADRLSRERSALSARCARFPPLPEDQREAVAAAVLAELNTRLQNRAREVSMDDLRRADPALACRLRSFRSAEEALRRARQEGGGGGGGDRDRDRGGMPPHKRQRPTNPYPQGVVGRVIASLVNNNGHGSRNNVKKSSNRAGGGKPPARQVTFGAAASKGSSGGGSRPGLFTIKGLSASPRSKAGTGGGGPRQRQK